MGYGINLAKCADGFSFLEFGGMLEAAGDIRNG